MTPKELSSEKYSFSGVCDTALDGVAYGDYPAYMNLDTYLQAISHYESPITEPDKADKRPQPSESRHRGLDRVLTKLSGMEIPCKQHVEEYLRDQHRRHLRPTSLRNSLITIESFLIFLKKRGRSHLGEITKGDLEAFIEHEQDRGLKASTVNTRLRTLKAFLRFLVERDIVRSEVLSKRLTIKVPNPLPRAMDPDDVKRLL